MEITNQVKGLAPSIKPALYRRLMIEPNLAYLRKDHSIIGFEVEMTDENVLSGYAIIAIQKHTILAMCSDLDEPPRLILFPSIEKLRDPAFELQNLHVIRTKFNNDTFQGMGKKKGLLLQVAENIIPPHHDVDIDDDVTTAMSTTKDATSGDQPNSQSTDSTVEPPMDTPPVDEQPPMDEPPIETPPVEEPPMDEDLDALNEAEYMDDTPFDDSVGEFDKPDPVPEPAPEPVDPRIEQLEKQSFNSLDEVSNFAILELNINSDIVNKVIYAALNATANKEPSIQTQVAVLLLEKIIKAKKV